MIVYKIFQVNDIAQISAGSKLAMRKATQS
jgi:hypothetical protein